MNIKEYEELMNKEFDKAYKVASAAREKGYDPEPYVEISKAPDLASRVEGIVGYKGVAELIRSLSHGQPTRVLAFDVAKAICTDERFKQDSIEATLTLAVRVGLAILTDGVLVAPTEGMQGIKIYKNPDNTTYASIIYAGPIRSAGGTAAALSVVLVDYLRRVFNIGEYKPSSNEVERYIEEIELYDQRIARLQYKPPEDHIRIIVQNCPVCVDSIASHDIEVGVHRDIKRIRLDNTEETVTNKVRSGIGLVICEGIAQKAKSVLKYANTFNLNWGWLEKVIKVDKAKQEGESNEATFLSELVAGRPVLAYPKMSGSFRLRYGRSRFTGIAAKGFNPATMILLDDFIAVGTQLKIETPGKGCVAVPVDTIEGPFVKLTDGRAFRINTADEARKYKSMVQKIISVGDILVTYGDFKKTNTQLIESSYVEEFWEAELRAKGVDQIPSVNRFKDAYEISKSYGIPMHPRYIYEYQDVSVSDLIAVIDSLYRSDIKHNGSLFSVESIKIKENVDLIRHILERLCIPHRDFISHIIIENDDAQALLATLGFSENEQIVVDPKKIDGYRSIDAKSSLELINKIAPFKVMKRSSRIGARIGRPEKARERLMKPPPHVLFPLELYGGSERNVVKAYNNAKKRFDNRGIELTIANYECPIDKELIVTPYCDKHKVRAVLQRSCNKCGIKTVDKICPRCGSETVAYSKREIDIVELYKRALDRLNEHSNIEVIKGIKGLTNADKIPEPLEKGILRAKHNVHIFKDGTARFDGTDVPITHFYPREVGITVEKARQLGYTTDYKGAPLERDDQLIELRHQDIIIPKKALEFLYNVANYIDELLEKYYGLERFYNLKSSEDIIGQYVITLSPHTSAGVLNRIVGYMDVNAILAHPYTISARRRNCDGDEDTMMLLLDALINFSRNYLPSTIGGTMDAPIVLTVNVHPEEVDDEVHEMEVQSCYDLNFYRATLEGKMPGDLQLDTVGSRLGKETVYDNLNFTHLSSINVISSSPKRSRYTILKSMQEKIEAEFSLIDKLECVNKSDAARKLILSHFLPDLIGNLHSYFKQGFRCTTCNAKYRRVPIKGVCERCGGKLTLTISRGSIEKYLDSAEKLAERYNLDNYIKQRIRLIRYEIKEVFGSSYSGATNLTAFM
ncbi:MAG: DNA polymerase II large subunit [Candidatus Micrarchaeota archaeon]|nr:MAG: DNA polymerase II large subunit [Candidatus Micrarchaeota archaeon]